MEPAVKIEDKVEEKKEQQPVQQSSNVVVEASQETDKDINWKKFKEAREQDRKRAEEESKRAADKEAEVLALKAAMEAILSKPNHQQPSNLNSDEEETEDQRIEKKVEAKLAQREIEFEKRRRDQEAKETPNRLLSMFPDYEKVVSNSNIDYMEYHHPELAKSLGQRPDSLEKFVDIYNAMKRYVPNTDTKKDAAKAESNLKKPGSLSRTGVTQGGNAMPGARLDEQRKADNWARMQKSLKGMTSEGSRIL